MKKIILTILCFPLLCNCSRQEEDFNPETVKNQIELNSKKWGEALLKQDASIIANMYDEKAHYIPDDDFIKHGNQVIAENWRHAFGLTVDLQHSMESLEGTKEILYETGTGWVAIDLKTKVDTFRFNYCNVWKLQKDNTYKIVVDMYNDFPKN